MREYLDNLSKELVFYIEIENTPYGKIKIKDIEQFFMLNYSEFRIVISY